MLNESVDRPAWVSDVERGMFHSYKHRHRKPNNNNDEDCIERFFFGHTEGFSNRSQAAELREGGGK